jgi:hypothetical protein
MYRNTPPAAPPVRRLGPFNKERTMRSIPSKTEMALLAACLALHALALFGPALHLPGHGHGFADPRALWGVPFAMDVLSNLPFALAGLAGIASLLRRPGRALADVERAMAWLFFSGLVFTSLASGWYHWGPDDTGLAIDRCGMAVAFAGLLGLAAATRISERAGAALGLGVLGLAPLAASAALATGNVLPWAVTQFGGMALILWFTTLRTRPAALDFRLGFVILAYAAAKLLEMNDHAVYEFSGQLVSGHTLKHVVASLAAWPLLAALQSRAGSVQNAARTGGSPARRAGHA